MNPNTQCRILLLSFAFLSVLRSLTKVRFFVRHNRVLWGAGAHGRDATGCLGGSEQACQSYAMGISSATRPKMDEDQLTTS